MTQDWRGAKADLTVRDGKVGYFRLDFLQREFGADLAHLPHTIKILLENLLRRAGTRDVAFEDVIALARWPKPADARLAYMPSRVLMQDFTGVPAVVDLAALRSAMARSGGAATRVNPSIPVDLVIDHSVQVDRFGTADAYRTNIELEYERNAERYALLRWAQQAFDNFRVVTPGAGICHQVNLEHLGRVVGTRDGVAFPDTLVGTDSHTTMINGLGILGWGVGGIEAEAAMLGQPMFLSWPVVVGVRTVGALPPGTTATDLVLTLTQLLRKHGVVGKFVEFFGAGLSSLSVADRATLSNMCPEYGATASFFPVDAHTVRFLAETGRGALTDLVERYTKEQALFRTDADPEPSFTELVELDLSAVQPSLAGPRRPQDRVVLAGVWPSFVDAYKDRLEAAPQSATQAPVKNGSVVIAAITSCTNTSNPSVMIAAGLLARKAVARGLTSQPWVKTSLAPGSRVVTAYLEAAGVVPALDALGFNLVGYGCTTCIGNSGPLAPEIERAVKEDDLAVVAVLSGNRNFEGRIHPFVRASYLASPPLCVAYAIAGRIDLDLTKDPLGTGSDGKPVYLADVWPSHEEVSAAMRSAVTSAQFEREYAHVFEGDEHWQKMAAPTGSMFAWDLASTYVREAPFFTGITSSIPALRDIEGARVLVMVGDSVTTDHISPAGSIRPDSPAGKYLQEHGVAPVDFNSYGSRRGNHEVMMRGTFANIRLKNQLAPGTEGPWTTLLPENAKTTIYDASMEYQKRGVPLAVIAGKEYGSGSSRDWAAKGPALLGIRFALAESYERIHRSNLVGMGILPLQFKPGDSAASLGLTGRETFSVRGLAGGIRPRQDVTVDVTREDGSALQVPATLRIDTAAEVEYYHHGGVLQMVLRQMIR